MYRAFAYSQYGSPRHWKKGTQSKTKSKISNMKNIHKNMQSRMNTWKSYKNTTAKSAIILKRYAESSLIKVTISKNPTPKIGAVFVWPTWKSKKLYPLNVLWFCGKGRSSMQLVRCLWTGKSVQVSKKNIFFIINNNNWKRIILELKCV